ncbi:hypothetical protein AAMO2058_000221200 [Amorphochlora amoebiformis]
MQRITVLAAACALALLFTAFNASNRHVTNDLGAQAFSSRVRGAKIACRRPALHALARRTRDASPLSVMTGLVGAILVSSMLSGGAEAAIKKGAPILATEAPPAIEIQMDEMHGQAEMMSEIGNWDTDKNGRISRQEFDAGMKNYVPHELSPGQLDQAWQRVQGVEIERRATDPSYAGNILTDEQKQLPQPGQPFTLPTSRVESTIPKSKGGFWQYPSPQQAYNAMVRKGKDPDINRAKDFVSTHNEMNERGWAQVLRYEAITHPECAKEGIKLSKFNGDYDGRVKGSFDRHYWTVNRCGLEEQKYVLDYFDTKKFDEMTMPYTNDDIEIRVRPDSDVKGNLDAIKHQVATGSVYGSTADPGAK